MGTTSARTGSLYTRGIVLAFCAGIAVASNASGSPPTSGLLGKVREGERHGLVREVYRIDDLIRARAQTEESLIALVTNTVEPLSWKGAGGRASLRIDARRRELVVWQTPERQSEVAALLAVLRQLPNKAPERMPKGPPDPAD